jgi:FlaG/FlaF family flagellin (archaellin)
MVAITVVLAAVLYLLVSGLIGGGGASEPNINLNSGQTTGTSGEWKIEVAGASSGEGEASFNVLLLNGTGIAVTSTSLDTLGSSCSGSPGLSFTDVQADGKLNQGDWFIVCGTDSTSDYQVQVFWKASNNKVSGDTGKVVQ